MRSGKNNPIVEGTGSHVSVYQPFRACLAQSSFYRWFSLPSPILLISFLFAVPRRLNKNPVVLSFSILHFSRSGCILFVHPCSPPCAPSLQIQEDPGDSF
ncbi:hypothetical protein AMECASPLE_025291 [Ameca splendens]|uniref:Uncharacterized protein n=1 Tax=Ameca splendens TaxID=208324 RepID=A0ABV1AAZ1_9TELE